jgi:hypothetical protein
VHECSILHVDLQGMLLIARLGTAKWASSSVTVAIKKYAVYLQQEVCSFGNDTLTSMVTL